MPLQYNPTDSRFLTVAQSRTNNGQKDIRIILDLPTNDFYSLDDDGNFNVIGASGGTQTLADVLDIGNTTGPNNILIDDGQSVNMDNGSILRKGTTDGALGGAKGIAQICSINYELKWEAGRLYVMQQDGFTIRQVLFQFNVAPTIDDDDTKGYVVGSRWTLDNGRIYVCSDNTTGAAVWTQQTISIDYTEYVAFVTQSGATAPTAVVVDKNDTGFVFTYGYTSTGQYTIIATGAFPDKNKVIPYFNSQVNQGFTTIGWSDADTRYVATTDTSAVLTNGQFEGNLVIRIYN
jgi:hypothetical protein